MLVRFALYLLVLGLCSLGGARAELNLEDMEEDERLIKCAQKVICGEQFQEIKACKENMQEEYYSEYLKVINKLMSVENHSDEQLRDKYCSWSPEKQDTLLDEFVPEFIDEFSMACRNRKSKICVGYSKYLECAYTLIADRVEAKYC